MKKVTVPRYIFIPKGVFEDESARRNLKGLVRFVDSLGEAFGMLESEEGEGVLFECIDFGDEDVHRIGGSE